MKGVERTGHYPRAFHLVWGSALTLLVIGLVQVYSVSAALAFAQEHADPLRYLREQGGVAVAGLALAALAFLIDYRAWRRLIPLAMLASLVLLAAVYVPGLGHTVKGATRSIIVGPVNVQPSELVKLALVLCAAHLLARAASRTGRGDLWLLGLVAGVSCAMILQQKDLGTAAVVAATTMGILWVAGVRVRYLTLLAGTGVAAVAAAIVAEPFRMERLMAFLNPSADLLDSGYQVRQGLLALGRGGLFGVGAGNSVQKFSYLPEAHTDMIFAVLGEEFGLIGVGVVVGLFTLLAVAAFQLARRCSDPFGRYLVAGCAILIYSQALINMGGVMAALPLTGVPLPFISYGRNNLLVMMMAVGVIMSVARWGPVAEPSAGVLSGSNTSLESMNVTYLDSGRGDSGARSARAGRR
jgi:cell division protein FtsW